jgi:hypothetical protein
MITWFRKTTLTIKYWFQGDGWESARNLADYLAKDGWSK